ncbi:MAG: hypothetical protein KAG72_08415 [Abyssibacter sp.]|nr:hypothetical protein [Abyssibacter sp.]MCK5859352.1 hypothetical protein [Abyssibacter sp.]
MNSSLRSNLTLLIACVLIVSRILGAHAHACSDGDPDCLNELHAEAIVHAEESCADETCVDTRVEAADGVLAKLLDLDGGEVLAITIMAVLGLLLVPVATPPIARTLPPISSRFGRLPPARAPPATL